jgi:hypothetical protein
MLCFREGELLSTGHYRSCDRACGAIRDKRSTSARHVLPYTFIDIGLEQQQSLDSSGKSIINLNQYISEPRLD